jgi:hypothetical protein
MRRFAKAPVVPALALAVWLGACGGSDVKVSEPPQVFVAEAADFECLLEWPAAVRNFRLTNRVGLLDEALDLARDPEVGRQYPVGTIIQLFPGEAMVKRGSDYDPANNNWEYFELNVSADGTEIRKRGRDDVINMFGGQCWGCHVAARDFDFICEDAHGCIDLPITGPVVTALQEADPRCK